MRDRSDDPSHRERTFYLVYKISFQNVFDCPKQIVTAARRNITTAFLVKTFGTTHLGARIQTGRPVSEFLPLESRLHHYNAKCSFYCQKIKETKYLSRR